MKTAIIKTDFWKSDKMAELSIDARMTYLCVLTSPERNGTPVVKVSNRMLTFYTGFNQKQVEVSLDHLQENGLIKLFDGYIIINNQDWVEPKKGKLSKVLYEKEMSELPDNIKGLLLSGSREPQECISISISKGISNSKSTSTGRPELQDVIDYCKERNNSVNAEQFMNFYQSNGWKVGKNPMKDWKACVRTWETNNLGDKNKIINYKQKTITVI